MKFIVGIILLLGLHLGGCSLIRSKPSIEPQPASPHALYHKIDLASLLLFSDGLTKLPDTERMAECQQLLRLSSEEKNLGVSLHLFLVQMLTKECGDIRETLAFIQAARFEIPEDGLRQFLNYQQKILARIDDEILQTKELEKRLKLTSRKIEKSTQVIKSRTSEMKSRESEFKTLESELKSRENELRSREAELKSLRDKLDALKSIEKNLGGPQDGTMSQ